MKIVQCVPNFSEGRDLSKVEEIVSVLKDKEGFNLVSYEPDKDYNRTVVTLLGNPEAIIEALIPFTEKCLNLIDMNYQTGEHARMGAVDVIPFIPIQDVEMDECVTYANTVAKRINDQFNIPIFMYAEAANQKSRVKLPNIRKGEFEGMKDKIKDDKWAPDYGKQEIHPTFGVIGVGARIPLIAYNIDLSTENTKRTGAIARAIRFSSGGFRHIQAGPVFLDSRGHTQVTMNILNYKKNPIYRVLETVKMEAKRYHIDVPSCELVGLIPKEALLKSIKYYFQVEGKEFDVNMSLDDIVKYSIMYIGFRDFDKSKIIEANI
jgi:glutamate formiminotransferase